jgi:hypothetical protein
MTLAGDFLAVMIGVGDLRLGVCDDVSLRKLAPPPSLLPSLQASMVVPFLCIVVSYLSLPPLSKNGVEEALV